MEAAAAHLLDFSKDFDVTLLDQIVAIAYDGQHPKRQAANEFLVNLQEHPDMWRRADAILETSKQPTTRFFGLQILENSILTRWKTIPVDQREGVRNYIVSKIIALASSDETLRIEHQFLSKLNMILVQVLKQDWPHHWPSFISDIVGSSKTSETLCENNMKILRLLSEEVFDFSKDSMTAAKIKTMKESLNEEFLKIFELCQLVLEASQRPTLIEATLLTLQRFLTWIPLGYIFETSIIPTLVNKFFPVPVTRTAALDCLTEIASLPAADIPEGYRPILQQMLIVFLQQLTVMIPPQAHIAAAYASAYSSGNERDCIFIQRLALFLNAFLSTHMKSMEGTAARPELLQAIIEAHGFLIRVSEVQDEDVFKTCLEYWAQFSKDLYTSETAFRTTSSKQVGVGVGQGLMFGGSYSIGSSPPEGHSSPTVQMFEEVLHSLRIAVIDRMAKPEEVIVVEDENGDIVRERAKDTDVIAQYKTMRDTIVYLSHLNYDDTEAIMLEKLDAQVDGGCFSRNGLNTLCWAIGSISGAMGEGEEKRFLVTVIKDLLRLCEEQRGKDNKAVVASNIMYIVGQYPRFLKAHWKFLKTVVNKLFEFMHEHHPGVQDMACDTFMKIAQKCKRKFMTLQTDEVQPFIVTLIGDLGKHTKDLQVHQVQSFYESVACMLADKSDAIELSRQDVVVALMELPNTTWKQIVSQGAQNVQSMMQVDVIREISRILKMNARVCSAAGSVYVHQLSTIFLDAISLYRLYSEQIIQACAAQGEIAARHTNIKAMRGAKSDFLDLMTTFLQRSHDIEGGPREVMTQIMPQLMAEVLQDYRNSPPSARDAGVLNLFATATVCLKDQIAPEIPRVLDAVFEPTLQMISQNMTDFPEHRLNFYRFLKGANEHCFSGLFNVSPQHQKLVIDSIVWAFKHTERNISETGLEILLSLLQNISRTPQISGAFYQQFILTLIQEIFGIMTDRLHKSGLRLQSIVMQNIFHAVQLGQIAVPLFDTAAFPHFPDNASFLKEHVVSLLISAFPNMTRIQVVTFVMGLFDVSISMDAFKQHIRDFLVNVKEFAVEDNADLYTDETSAHEEELAQQQWQYRASVPGLLSQTELGIDPDL